MKNVYILLITNLNLSPVIVLNFAFTVYGNILNLIKVVTFLDASKAFDRIDHWSPFTKLIDKHVLLFVIKLLVF